ncbi:hypothetical protein BCON_0192g00230 [Botryotinia convoluta]|uniref:GIY-YIG domain-containing protein n=1 Tax=Botryotinia convoluta TaxID=54673 RepID=A0A4Z1HMQ2_9HELO|nr:hypothetical protein BCON_0192g00230 [Botryotinia convoluta]
MSANAPSNPPSNPSHSLKTNNLRSYLKKEANVPEEGLPAKGGLPEKGQTSEEEELLLKKNNVNLQSSKRNSPQASSLSKSRGPSKAPKRTSLGTSGSLTLGASAGGSGPFQPHRRPMIRYFDSSLENDDDDDDEIENGQSPNSNSVLAPRSANSMIRRSARSRPSVDYATAFDVSMELDVPSPPRSSRARTLIKSESKRVSEEKPSVPSKRRYVSSGHVANPEKAQEANTSVAQGDLKEQLVEEQLEELYDYELGDQSDSEVSEFGDLSDNGESSEEEDTAVAGIEDEDANITWGRLLEIVDDCTLSKASFRDFERKLFDRLMFALTKYVDCLKNDTVVKWRNLGKVTKLIVNKGNEKAFNKIILKIVESISVPARRVLGANIVDLTQLANELDADIPVHMNARSKWGVYVDLCMNKSREISAIYLGSSCNRMGIRTRILDHLNKAEKAGHKDNSVHYQWLRSNGGAKVANFRLLSTLPATGFNHLLVELIETLLIIMCGTFNTASSRHQPQLEVVILSMDDETVFNPILVGLKRSLPGLAFSGLYEAREPHQVDGIMCSSEHCEKVLGPLSNYGYFNKSVYCSTHQLQMRKDGKTKKILKRIPIGIKCAGLDCEKVTSGVPGTFSWFGDLVYCSSHRSQMQKNGTTEILTRHWVSGTETGKRVIIPIAQKCGEPSCQRVRSKDGMDFTWFENVAYCKKHGRQMKKNGATRETTIVKIPEGQKCAAPDCRNIDAKGGRLQWFDKVAYCEECAMEGCSTVKSHSKDGFGRVSGVSGQIYCAYHRNKVSRENKA